MPSQRFKGRAVAAEAVGQKRSLVLGIPAKQFLFLLGQPAEIGGQWRKTLTPYRQVRRCRAHKSGAGTRTHFLTTFFTMLCS